jgi:hypothetical protein
MTGHLPATCDDAAEAFGPGGSAARRLGLAAAPTFAAMALLTAFFDVSDVCAAAPQGWSLGGMMSMYLLMGVFHLPPWLRLVSGQRAGAAQPDTRRFSARQGAGA